MFDCSIAWWVGSLIAWFRLITWFCSIGWLLDWLVVLIIWFFDYLIIWWFNYLIFWLFDWVVARLRDCLIWLDCEIAWLPNSARLGDCSIWWLLDCFIVWLLDCRTAWLPDSAWLGDCFIALLVDCFIVGLLDCFMTCLPDSVWLLNRSIAVCCTTHICRCTLLRVYLPPLPPPPYVRLHKFMQDRAAKGGHGADLLDDERKRGQEQLRHRRDQMRQDRRCEGERGKKT